MEGEYMFYVYEWFIVETGEIIYVGKGTRNRYKVRKHNRLFNEMILKHNCESRIVKEFEQEKDAFEYEFERVLELKLKGQCVCNIYNGGTGGTTAWWNDEYRERYSKNNVMKAISQRERMTTNNPMKDKNVSRKVAEKISRKVCIEDEIYGSLASAAASYSVSPQLFIYWLERGYTKDHKRCYYYGEQPKELKILNNCGTKEKISVTIDGIAYESIKKAAKAVGGNDSYLSKALRKNKPYKGHICQYGNQQPSQGKSDNSTLEGSTTNG